MSNKTSEQIEILQKNLLPNVFGILWITEDDLFMRPSPFNALDYFMDGLLTDFYKEKKKNPGNIGSRKNFFVTNNFNTSFFIGHIKDSAAHLENDLEGILDLAKTIASDRDGILIINQSKSKVISKFKEATTQFNFGEIIF